MESMPFRKPGSLREIGPANFDSVESGASFSGEALVRALSAHGWRRLSAIPVRFLVTFWPARKVAYETHFQADRRTSGLTASRYNRVAVPWTGNDDPETTLRAAIRTHVCPSASN